MAKETTIIFVYDTDKLQNEEDDPASAILYFHPTWVSDQQKTALCGQIVGTISCLKSIFSMPKVVCLQTGKFYIIENGQYILAVGTDRNIADWLLEHRGTLLYSLVTLFNKDFDMLGRIYKDEALKAKLYHLFETYLRMLFYGGSIFSHVPVLCLPKSASAVFTEAVTFLEACREYSHVLGGTLLYHNKVVATQLPTDITKRIVIADPYRIKSPAEPAETAFKLPLGVQLLQVYITNKDFCDLLETSMRNKCIFQYLNNKSIKRAHSKSSSEAPIVSAMKRDQSLLFTAVPEEGPDNSEITFVTSQKKQRPKFLNLKSVSVESNESKATPMTPFCGQTSVASTPMTELKRFVHQNPLTLINKPETYEDDTESPDKDKSPSKPKGRSNSALHLSEILNDPGRYPSVKAKLGLSPRKHRHSRRSKSIHDPSFPLLKLDGIAISKYYYEDLVEKDSRALVSYSTPNKQLAIEARECQIDTKGANDISKVAEDNKLPKERRRSLILPLKPISGTEGSKNERRLSLGVQLTPLMSKLSVLAFEERTIKDSTPLGATPTQPTFPFTYKTKEIKNLRLEDGGALRKCLLFVCGQQDVVTLLLMKEECCKDEETIVRIWETCTEHLGKLEKQLNFCLESQSSGTGTQESEPYSFLCLDAKWDTVKRGGPWGTGDLSSLVSLHRDFTDTPDITEILLRNTDSAIYGYHCGPSEVFYHEGAGAASGLPLPSDPVGLIQTKAKRRLERDHAVVLL